MAARFTQLRDVHGALGASVTVLDSCSLAAAVQSKWHVATSETHSCDRRELSVKVRPLRR